MSITTAGSNLLETSATNLNLAITNETEFKNLIDGYRDGFHKTAGIFRDEAANLGRRKREALWKDLGAALSIIEVIQHPDYAEWLEAALDATGIPVVEDDAKQNIYVMYLRLLMGHWPARPKSWRVGDSEPKFTWSENVWLYASVLRGAVKRGINGKTLYAKIKAEGNLNKFKNADRKRLSEDQEEKDKKARLKLATSKKLAKATLEASKFNGPKSSSYVSLYGKVSADGKTIEILGLFDDKSESVEARIQKYADKQGATLRAEKPERERDAALAQIAADRAMLDEEAKHEKSEADEADDNSTVQAVA